MAKKKVNLEVTPIMALSMFAIFAMMPFMFRLSGATNRTEKTKAAEPVVLVTPSPTPEAEMNY